MVKKKTEKTEAVVAKDEKTSLVDANKDLAGAYEDDQVTDQDIILPRILLMQGLSTKVAEGKAKSGQIIDSLSGGLLADVGKSIEVLPIYRFKSFRLFKDMAGKPQFVKEVPYDADTIDWETKRIREIEEDGEKLKVFITLNVFVLVVDKIKALPYMLSFSSTNYKVGKQFNSLTIEAKKAGLALPFKTYIFSQEHTKNEKGQWFLYTVKKGRPSVQAELDEVGPWLKLIKAGKAKAAEAEDDEVAAPGDSTPMPNVEEGEVGNDSRF